MRGKVVLCGGVGYTARTQETFRNLSSTLLVLADALSPRLQAGLADHPLGQPLSILQGHCEESLALEQLMGVGVQRAGEPVLGLPPLPRLDKPVVDPVHPCRLAVLLGGFLLVGALRRGGSSMAPTVWMLSDFALPFMFSTTGSNTEMMFCSRFKVSSSAFSPAATRLSRLASTRSLDKSM